MLEIKGQLVDIDRQVIYGAVISIANGRITAITPSTEHKRGPYLLPGFVDAHVHIESSLLTPVEFAKLAVMHGTVATVSDPHEIANVLGIAGVEYMLQDAARTPLTIHFGAPSCVPATAFETAGATLDAAAVAQLLARDDIGYLSEVMNFPGVLGQDPDLMAKIAAARRLGKPIDGHAPGLRGAAARQYAAAGITTDHECVHLDEARDKIAAGMKILIREGSAARNFDALIPLMAEHPAALMFCTDDSHPDDLLAGHINRLVSRAVRADYDLYAVLRAACRNPVEHYGLDIGQLKIGDWADFIMVDDLRTFGVQATYLRGQLVSEAGAHCLPLLPPAPTPNVFNCSPKQPADFRVRARGPRLHAIRVYDGELITGREWVDTVLHEGYAVAAPERDLLKVAVVNRYANHPPAVGFVRGFRMQRGALASSVAHDSHNIVAVGEDDEALCTVVNAIIEARGGIAAVRGERLQVLPLPVAGIMSNESGPQVAAQYSALTGFARRSLRCELRSPFMSLSFLALLVIPALKMSDRGLFDGERFALIDLFDAPPS